MKRRQFLQSLAAIALAPKILEQLAPAEKWGGVGHYFDWDALYDVSRDGSARWTSAVNNTTAGRFDEVKLRQARDRIYAMHGRPARYNRRIYERTGWLVEL